MPERGRAIAVAAPIIVAIVLCLFGISYLLSALFGLPTSINLPIVVRLAGGAIVAVGLATIGWTFQNRNPANVIVSTYITLVKAIRRSPIAEKAGRTEPLIVSGPQRYVRSPLYLGVIVMVFGWALVGGYTFVIVATLVLLVWFGAILIPFEERELRALFGEEWERYSSETPMLFPFTKRRKRSTAPAAS